MDSLFKNCVAWLLQAVVVLFAGAVVIFLLVEPHFEGRNVHATVFEVYFHDPFLAYVYVGSTPFFVALYRAFVLLGHIRQHGIGTRVSVEGLRVIQLCAKILLGVVVVGAVFMLALGDKEDRPPAIAMTVLCALATGGVAATAGICRRRVQKALDRSEGRGG